MNQDTHLYIEANQKHGRGYQVHIVIDGIVDEIRNYPLLE